MAIIASIAAAFSLNTAQFRDEVKRARSSLRAFEKGIKKTFGALKKFVKDSLKSIFSLKGAFATLAGSAGIGLLVASSLSAVDHIGKMSRVYKIATEDLGAFTLAASLGGTQLDTMLRAVRNVSRNVIDFQQGVGEAKDAFDQLGITQNDINKVMGDQVALMGLVGEKLNQVEDATRRTAFANDILGGRAVEVLTAIEGGRSALEGFRREAQELGIALSQDAVTGVEKANDAIARLGLLFRGLRDQTVSALAPALETVVTKIKNFILESARARGGIQNLGRDIATSILSGIKSALTGVEQFVNVLKQVKQALIDVGIVDNSVQEKRIAGIKREIENRNETIAIIQRLNPQSERLNELLALREEAQKRLNEAQGTEISIIDRARTAIDQLTESINKNISAKNTASSASDGASKPQAFLETVTKPDNVGPGLDTSAAERIEQLKQSFMSEEELLKNSLIEKQLLIDEAWKTQQIKTSERNQLLLDIQEDYHRQLAQIEREKQQQTLSSTASIFGSLASIVGQGSKKAFEQAKKFARAETLISTYAAAQKAFHATIIPGDPTSVGRAYLAAAAAVSAGLSRLVAINRTSFGSSSAAASNTGSGSFTTGPGSGPTTPNQSSNTSSPQQQIVIFWGGGRNGPPSSDEFRGFVQQLRSAINNDGLVLADRNSQQAYELSEVLSGVG